ncbi:VWA domain-containing protein [Paenibacillus spiritus]|uniref:VWA domain-containing protein n=1 Tax=Paenibacillus spiritus TaxID=2496557 RepID=A0A5J5G9E5_9BACL|nr:MULTISPECIES: vWA domain-containing protein [Paenibacillus]KAA9004715.1 VWA domain-containing protein [Paenibacillus spiritus]
MQRKINALLLLFSLAGGAAAFAAGELLLGAKLEEWPPILVVGLYFALVALGVGAGCLLAEMISPRLNGASWRQRYLGLSWKLLPLAVALLLGVGSLTEFIYELNFGGSKPVKDIVLVIDDSGSMSQSDPSNRRYEAARELIASMDGDNRVAVVSFSDEAAVAQPLIRLKGNNRERVLAAIGGLSTTDGGTNLRGALAEAMNVITGASGKERGAMVILLSDGVSSLDLESDLAAYREREVAVNTIGLALTEASGTSLLRDMAASTGGAYYDVEDAERLGAVFREIYDRLGDRTLLTERTDDTADSPYYAAVRVLALLLAGTALGIGLGIIFDNRYLARSFGTGGAVSGLLAGLTLEFGLGSNGFLNGVIRLIAVLLLAGVMALFTAVIPIGEGRMVRRGRRDPVPQGPSSGYRRPGGRSSKGF